MIIFFIVLLLNVPYTSPKEGATPYLKHFNQLSNIAGLNDAQHRGPRWYDHNTDTDSGSEMDSSSSTNTDSETSSYDDSSSESSSASSFETRESKMIKRVYRTCKPCPYDMMKKYKNIGIKWICGGYQRARRSFKSICMMRYRNCEDGTLFVKLHEHRCNNDTYHGNHFFYFYRT